MKTSCGNSSTAFYLDEISARRVLLTVLQDKAVVYDLVNRVENLYYGFNEVED